jgi:hypothetical protein
MRRIIVVLLVLSSVVFSQEMDVKNLFELNQEIALNNFEEGNQSFTNQLPGVELPARKNAGLAILYSFLLPGMGELYAESYSSGMHYTIADAALWGTFTGFNLYGAWKEDNYKAFAESRAGVSLDNKDEEYFANISVYQSIDDFNKAQELQRNYNGVYNLITHYWDWKNSDTRREYREMWSSSEQAYNNVRFVVGALVLNRVISAINAVRLVSRYNKNLTSQNDVSFFIGYSNKPNMPSHYTLNIITNF